MGFARKKTYNDHFLAAKNVRSKTTPAKVSAKSRTELEGLKKLSLSSIVEHLQPEPKRPKVSHKQSESENQCETEDIENVSSTSDVEDMSSVVEDTIEAHSSAKQTEPSNQKDSVHVEEESQLSLKQIQSNQERMLQNQQMILANQ